MMDIETLQLNGKEYLILREVNYNNYNYLYMVNKDDEDDIVIRKEKDDNVYPLESDEEFDKACGLLFKDIIIKKES